MREQLIKEEIYEREIKDEKGGWKGERKGKERNDNMQKRKKKC